MEIRSENAAKPPPQASRYLLGVIAALPPVAESFDYGCGKLRYAPAILDRTERLTLVDSEVQLSRRQSLGAATKTSIRSLIQGSNRMSAANVGEFQRAAPAFDRGFCINVLSVIPIEAVRRRVVRLILSRLRPGGSCLFVVQYRNSDFTRMAAMPNARRWHDGIMLDSLRGFSFYGLLRPEYLKRLVADCGFCTSEVRLRDGSAYLLANRG